MAPDVYEEWPTSARHRNHSVSVDSGGQQTSQRQASGSRKRKSEFLLLSASTQLISAILVTDSDSEVEVFSNTKDLSSNIGTVPSRAATASMDSTRRASRRLHQQEPEADTVAKSGPLPFPNANTLNRRIAESHSHFSTSSADV
jgi:hypothetical protein